MAELNYFTIIGQLYVEVLAHKAELEEHKKAEESDGPDPE